MDQQPDTIEPVEKPRRRWFQFRLRTLLIVAAIVAVPLAYIAHVVSTAPVRKGSYVILHVAEVPPSIWPTNKKPDREEFELYKRNLAETARSPNVINRLLDDRTIANLPLIMQHGTDAAEWLTDQIVVNNPTDSETLEIGLLDSDQKQATTIVQAIANVFQRDVIEMERSEKLKRRADLDKKFRDYKTTVLEKQRELFELEHLVGPKDDHKQEFASRLLRLEQAAAEADRAQQQAELQIARGKHKLEGLSDSSPEYKAIKSEIDLAEVDRKFWNGKSENLTAQINENAKQMVPEQKFTGDADQLRIEITQLQDIVNEMGKTLTKWNIELGAASRVTVMGTRSD